MAQAKRRKPGKSSVRGDAVERRSYRQFCGVAKSLDILGERWSLLIVRNLLLGPRRYTDLMSELPGITTNLLAKRLKELSEAGVLEHEESLPPNPARVYRLTALGAALEPVIMELGRWGQRFLQAPAPGDTVNIGWGLLSMKRRYLGGLQLVAEFVIDQRAFELSFTPSYLSVQQRAAVRPAVRVEGSLSAFQSWLFRNQPARTLKDQGLLVVTGEEAAFGEVADAFSPRSTAAQ